MASSSRRSLNLVIFISKRYTITRINTALNDYGLDVSLLRLKSHQCINTALNDYGLDGRTISFAQWYSINTALNDYGLDG